MKKIFMISLCVLYLLQLSACFLTEKPVNERGVRRVTADDILQINETMQYKDIMELLGETVNAPNPRGWFLYLVDDMQYLQLEFDSNSMSGAEILEMIKQQNTENPPEFIAIQEAAQVIQTLQIVHAAWIIRYADSDYIYISTETGGFYFRYNIKENKIDRALDCRDFLSYHIQVKADVGSIFSDEDSFVFLTTSGENLDSMEYREAFPSEYMYAVDFETENIAVASKGFDQSKFPPNYGEREDFVQKYFDLTKLNPDLPQVVPGSICYEAFQIEDAVYCVIIPENVNTQENIGSYEIFLVNVEQKEIIQKCAFSAMGL